jgi:XRE family aerobic/anaerobic benzoate catabolism transcriptional regulator
MQYNALKMVKRAASKPTSHPILNALGDRVRALRQERGLTLSALASQASLSLRFVSDVEGGRANISLLNLSGLAQALGVAPGALIEAPVPPPAVVALLGLRGAGKSTVGERLANRLGVRFFELDRLVEAESGMSLPELFAIHGEEYFRRQEVAALKRFFGQHPRGVLATGGGLVESPEAFRLLLERTFTVWLRASADEHWQRVVAQGDTRPMANRPHAMAELKRRLKEREPLYARARVACATSGQTVDQVVEEIVRAIPPLRPVL